MSTYRQRLAPIVLTVLALVVTTLGLVVAPPGGPPPGEAATRVAKDTCRRIDPNLVNGACLRYRTPRGSGLTWIGTYRAPDGEVFFCIDFLYDSRLPRRAKTVSTRGLDNQLGQRIGDAEVAALNYVISRWAGDGSTGSDDRDAAIALIVREVMSDGLRPGGVEVYPRGLEVGERVRPPIGGLDGRVMRLARAMWRDASAYRGPHRITITSRDDGPVRLGRKRTYRLRVISAAGRSVPGVRMTIRCTGPVRCRRRLVTTRRAAELRVRPREVGRFRLVATASGPSSDGLLYRQRSWHTHDGRTARPAGVQRGWIAQQNNARAAVSAQARVARARPEVVTRTSDAVVTPGARITDLVTVAGLPEGYAARVAATLYGPFEAQPGASDCVPTAFAGRVTFDVAGNGTFETPPVTVGRVGYYTWVEDFPGDDRTLPVRTPCGLVEETSVVRRRTPVVTTVASRQRARVGTRLHDTVSVRGLAAADRVSVRWRLLGPVPPRRGASCDGVRWGEAPVAARGELVARGNGRHRTRATRLRAPGCYSYGMWLPATATTEFVASEPGVPAETAVVTRPPTPYVPEVPSGAATAPSVPVGPLRLDPTGSTSPFEPAGRAEPRYLHRDYHAPEPLGRRTGGGSIAVARVGVRVSVTPVGLDDGVMAVPDGRRRMGWLSTTAAAGDVAGSSVLSGHVSDGPGGLGRLRAARAGDVVRWTSADGRVHRFVVRRVQRFPRARGLPSRLFRTDGPHLVHLVTCADLRQGPGSRSHYADNLVVTAEAIG